MAYSEIYLPKSDLDEYHVNREFYQPIDALDIKKTNQTWIAILRCDSKYGVKNRFYKWKKSRYDVKWKVDYARMDMDTWNIEHVQKFLEKYQN